MKIAIHSVPGAARSVRTDRPASRSTLHAPRIPLPAPRSTHPAPRSTSRAGGFTMIEIAISLAVIGFALVAIVGVLPMGMGVQKENRQETIINHDATVFMDAIRNGEMGLDDLVNYVMAITNTMTGDFYSPTSSPPFKLTSGAQIIGLLTTPSFPGGMQNHLIAYVRSLSGPASDKFPQNNPSVQDLGFNYKLIAEVTPCTYYDPDTNNAALARNLENNLYEVRLNFRWPLRPYGPNGDTGDGRQFYRTLVGGTLYNTVDPLYPSGRSNLWFFIPRTYVRQP